MKKKISFGVSRLSLLLRLTAIEVRTTYAGTIFGLAWVALGPILLLSLYSVIYALIFRVRVPNFTTEEYVLNVFSGLVPFLAFAQSLSAASVCIKKDRSLLMNGEFPAELVPIKAVLVAYLMLLVGIVMTFVGDVFFSTLSITWIFVPVFVVLQLLFSIGLAFYISIFSLVVKDIQFFIQYIVIALLVITPIAYTPDMIPEGMMVLLYANPLFYFIYSYQYLILLNELPPAGVMIPVVLMSLVFSVSGWWFYRRVQRVMVDLI